MMNCGIYRIQNILTGDCYYGKSVDLKARKRSHYNALKANRHCNKHLQYACNKYGIVNFVFSIVLYCEKFELVRYEQACVDYMMSTYNIQKECVTGNQGLAMSEEQKQKLSIANKGKKRSEEFRHVMSVANKGHTAHNKGVPMSEEQKHKLSLANIGRPGIMKGKKHTAETIIKLIESHTGHVHSEEHKHKISESLKGKVVSEDTRQKISATLMGHACKIISDETRRKQSESQKRRQAIERYNNSAWECT